MNEKRTYLSRRLLPLLLALCIVIGLVPLSVFGLSATSGAATYSAADDLTGTNVNRVLTYAENLLNTNYSHSGGSLSWDTEGKSDTWRYYNGVMLDALLMAGVDSDAGNALKFADAFYDAAVNSEGLPVRYASDATLGKELDSIAPARGLFYLLDTVEDQDKYETLLHSMYAQLADPTVFKTYDNAGGNYLHKTTWTDWQIGLDGIYMAQPFLMEYANAISDGRLENTNKVDVAEIYEAVYNRLVWVADNMAFSVEKDGQTIYLYNHGWNVDTSKGNGVVWARGVGWYAAALVDVIELMPAGTYKDGLISKLSKLFDGMIAYQDETTGMWCNVVYPVYTDATNELETSGTALMAYAMMKACNNGWVENSYGTAGLKAFNGLVANKVTETTISDIYKSSGVSTSESYYCTNSTYVSDEAKGVGPVIMAATQANIMNSVEETYSIGAVSAPEDLTVAINSTTIDSSNIQATLVSNRGNVMNVAGSALTYSVDTSTGVVTAFYNGTEIDTFTVEVIDTEGTTSATGTFVAVSGGTAPAGENTTASGDLTITTTGSTVYADYIDNESVSEGNFYTYTKTDAENGAVNYKSGKSFTYNGTIINKPLKMESATQITFDSTSVGSGTLLLVFNSENANSTIKFDGTAYTIGTDGTVTIENVSVGSHTITKGSAETWLGYISYTVGSGTGGTNVYTVALTADPTGKLLNVGEEATLSAAVTAVLKSDSSSVTATGTVTWSIKTGEATDVLSLNTSTGEIEALKAGETVVVASLSNVTIEGVTENISLSVEVPVTVVSGTTYSVSLTVTPSGLIMNAGDAVQPLTDTVTITDADANTIEGYIPAVTFASSDTSVATVDDTGMVTPVSAGNAVITATVAIVKDSENNEYSVSGASVEIPVVVNAESTPAEVTYEITGVVVLPSSIEVSSAEVSSTAQATAYTKASDGTTHTYTYNWSVQGDSSATIDSTTGKITAGTTAETVTVTATLATVDDVDYTSKNIRGTTTLTITDPSAALTYTLSAITFNPAAPKVGDTVTASTTITASDNSEHTYTVEWTIDGTEVPDETGTSITIPSETAKEVTVTAKLKTVDGVDYNGEEVSATANVTVTEVDSNTYVRINSAESVVSGKSYVIANSARTLGYGNGTTTDTKTAVWVQDSGSGEYRNDGDVIQLWTFELANEEENSYYICYTDTDSIKHYLVCDSDYYPSLTSFDQDTTTRWIIKNGVEGQANGQISIAAVNSSVDRVDLNVQTSGGAKLENSQINLNLYALVPPSYISLTVPPLMVGNTYTLAPTVKYNNVILDAGNYEVEYTSSNPNVAEVETDSEGNKVVHAIGEGTTTLTATLTTANGEAVSESITVDVTVSVAAPTIDLGDDLSLTVGETCTLTPVVMLGDAVLDAENYTVTYSSNSAVITVTQDGTLTVNNMDDPSATVTITATLETVNGSEVSGFQDTIMVTVDNPTYTLAPNTIRIPLNGKPDFSGITLTIDSSIDGKDVSVPNSNLEFRVVDSDLKTSAAGTYTVPVYYDGVERGTVTVIVDSDPYYGLKDADGFAEYPDAGAVRMEKFATSQNFTQTGVVQIELNAAGVSTKNAIDVVLVVDVSNSMGWTMDWFNKDGIDVANATDSQKIPTDSGTTKLDSAMSAAEDFASILLGGNTTDGTANNTLTFVTFGGHDPDRGSQNSSTTTYMDSVVTAFLGVEDLNQVNASFNSTKFTSLVPDKDGSVTYQLQIAGTDGTALASGTNRGNTNYDFAFLEAMAAVEALKVAKAGSVEAYDAGDREIHVVFMTDGAPSHYNDWCYGNGNTGTAPTVENPNYIEFQRFDNGSADVTDADWLEFIQNYNEDATELYSQVDGFYTVGFDLAHGGFGTHNWTEADLGRVLQGLVKNEALDYTLASDTQALNTFFTDLGNALSYAGTQAVVSDTLSSDFVLVTSAFDKDGNDSGTDMQAAEIQVLSRRLVLRSDIGKTLTIEGEEGQITLTADNIEQYLGARVTAENDTNVSDEILETVTFNGESVAYSSKKGESVDIWNETSGVINAQYFTYDFNTKTFTWNIGSITDREVALTYYAYLQGSVEGSRENGLYPTNKVATLTYIDINGDKASRAYPVPEVAWGAASVGVRFYLVNDKGEYVNMAGQTFTNPANRVFLTERTYYIYNLNSSTTITASDALAKTNLQASGIALYDDQIKFTVQNVVGGSGEAKLDVWTDFAAELGKKETNNLVDLYDLTGGTEFIQTIVNIPVVFTERAKSQPMVSDTVVLDFGKPIEIQILDSNELSATNKASYKIELYGFMPYKENFDVKLYLQPGEYPETAQTEYTADFGVLKITDDANGKLTFTPTTILDGVERVFCVVKFTAPDTDESGNVIKGTDGNPTYTKNNYYYLYNTLTIVPATSVYYETDFADGVFTTVGTWSTEGTSAIGNQDSDPGPDSQDTYGYDSSYLNDSQYSNGSSLRAEGEGVTTTTVCFSFTGTGFDIISRTGPNEGTIRVTVKDSNSEVVRTVSVINKGTNELYQIPVISVEGLTHGTYTVEIGVYNAVTYPENFSFMNRGNSFYFDAVRIYGTAEGDDTAETEYALDGEASALIQEVRDILITADSFDPTGQKYNEGAIFVEKLDSNEWTSGTFSYAVSDYKTVGPNNEVYLANGQAIAFKLGWTTAPASIDLAAKAVGAVANTEKGDTTDTDNASVTTDYGAKLNVTIREVESNTVTGTAVIDSEINTCTALYYDLLNSFTPQANGEVYVIIQNTGTGVLSLTDLKIAYGADTAGEANISLTSDLATYEAAETILNPECNVKSMAFADDSVRVMRTTTMTVETTQFVKTLKITDANGNPVWYTAVYVDTADGNRIWTVTLRPLLLGDPYYLVTGYDADGIPGEQTATDTIHVQY